MIPIFVALCFSHNGVVHKPGDSSSIGVAPAIGCNSCFTVYNYGQNYVKLYQSGSLTEIPFPKQYLPVAAMVVNGTVLASVDDNTRVKLITLGSTEIEINDGCPDPENLLKFIDTGHSLPTALDLKTGAIFTIDLHTESCTEIASFDAALEPDPLMYDGATFYGFAMSGEIKCWFYGVKKYGAAVHCLKENSTFFQSDRLDDGRSNPSNFHTGGDLFFANDTCLYATNGDTNPPVLTDGRVQALSHTAGKVLEWCNLETNPPATIKGVGLRHPWTTVQFSESQRAIADVGQESVEEISLLDFSVPGILNFGWPKFEGDAFRSAVAPYNTDTSLASILVADRSRKNFLDSYVFVLYLVIFGLVAIFGGVLLFRESIAGYQGWALLVVVIAGLPPSTAPGYRGFDNGVVASAIRTLVPVPQNTFTEWYVMTFFWSAALLFLLGGAGLGYRWSVAAGAVCFFVYLTTFVAMITPPAVVTVVPFVGYAAIGATLIAVVIATPVEKSAYSLVQNAI